MNGKPKRIFLVAGEHSGDFLGAALMRSLQQGAPDGFLFAGVGGEHMETQGLNSLFPLEDVAVMGFTAVLPHLPRIIRRVYRTVEAAVAFAPDLVVIIDSPEFTHAVARRIRKRLPRLPIIDYVSPSVWAWRPGRARQMRAYVNHVLALLPFEPEAHRRLDGPQCTYVGHPLIEKLGFIHACDGEALRARLGLNPGAKVLVVLPGSRRMEVERLMEPFGEAVARLADLYPGLAVVIPAVPSVRSLIEAKLADWPLQPHLVAGEADKFAAFNLADAALAASGTVTLELAVTKTPMVVAYRVSLLESNLRHLIKVHSIVLANLVLGENVFPEYIQETCTPDNLTRATDLLLHDSDALAAQRAGLDQIERKMLLDGVTPSEAAARVVRSYLQ